MNFDLSDEQRMLKESVSRLMANRYSFEDRKRHMAVDGGMAPKIWAEFAELGLLALPFAQEDGGIGGGSEEIMIVMEELGRALALEPYLQGVVIPSTLLRLGASAEERAELVEGIGDGSLRLVFAHGEAGAGYRLSHVETRATASGDSHALHGAKTLVIHGGTATHFLVSARLSGAPGDQTGIGLFLVAADAAGISRRDYPTQDGLRAAELVLEGAPARRLGTGEAFPALEAAADEAVAALCAEAVGAMDAALGLTVEYLKTRKQFGRVIGDFQALQHKASEMVVELEQARSMAIYASMMARNPNAKVRATSVSAAKVQVSRSARFIAQVCVQLHGGVGMTMEFAVGHYMKRLTMIEKAFGDVDYHLDRLAAAGGLAT